MKAIAEYFRDLAADDRYFGAEPPTPDAEMLQRIAEREIRKRVEAHVGEEGIVLRPEGARPGLTAEPAAQPPAPPPAEPTEAPVAEAPVAEAPAEVPVAEAPAEAVQPAEATQADSVAAKLARIRAVVDHARTAAPALEGYVEDEEPEPQVSDSAAGVMEAEEETAFAEEEAPAIEEAAGEPVRAPDAEEAEDAALLDAISRKLTPPPAAREAAEEAAVTEEEEIFESLEFEEEETFEVEEDLAAQQAGEELESTLSFTEEAELSVSIEEEAEPSAERPEHAGAETAEHPWEAPAAAEPEAETGAEARADVTGATGATGARAGRETDTEATQGAAARARARVLKVKRADLEGGPAPSAAEPSAKAGSEMGLSPEEEADLMAELAEVERDVGQTTRLPGRARLQPSAPEQEERTVSRLLETTNTKLEGSEQRRRRTAIAHLKAAVAATVAERRLSQGRDEKAEEAAEMAPYRQDLARAVRPSRPERQRAPKGKKLAPLMLVSEQRIDKPAAPAPGLAPARVQRAASGNLALQPHEEEEIESHDIGRFAEFVEEHAAQGLLELLEAAGAYMAEVEGLESFSRPQAMRLVDQAGDAEHSREDRLRAFGRLLREGKFRRIKRGRFAISDSSRFRAGKSG